VPWLLTHSAYKFAAASIADGSAIGYAEFLSEYYGPCSLVGPYYRNLYGGLPFGDHLAEWIKESPGFNLHKVHTPLRILSIGPDSLLIHWEMFAALSTLAKPVDMVYLPDGVHELQKPWERLVSSQGNVDWFRFWLQDYEDPDAAKSEQYIRWRELRKLRMAQDAEPAGPDIESSNVH